MKLMLQLNSLVAATLLLSQAGLSQTVKPQEKKSDKMDTIRNERNAKAVLPLVKKFQLIKGSKMAYTLTEGEKAFCGAWPNQVNITLPGHHHLQEDVPNEIGTAISVWILGLEMESSR